MVMLATVISLFLLFSSCFVSATIAADIEYCTEGNITLNTVNGSSYVLICSQGLWGYVCGRQAGNSPWTKENVGVACQQLGYIRKDSNDAPDVPELSNEQKNSIIDSIGVVHYRFIQCTGVEKRLIDCPHGTSSDINDGLCSIKKGSEYKFGIAPCTQNPVLCSTPGELRIVNNTNTVQICSQGDWYIIRTNENQWTESQAKVACRQMGLNPNGAKTSIMEKYNDKILNVAFHCEGHENTLSECSSSITEEGGTSTIAGVMCGDQTAPPLNVSATGNSHMITVSWDYDDNNIINSSVIFHVTCTGNSITLSTIINGTQGMMIHFPGVMPGVEYGCCVNASSPKGGPSETVCDSVSINKIVISTTDDLIQTTSATSDHTTITSDEISATHDTTLKTTSTIDTLSVNKVSSSTTVNGQFDRPTTSLLLSASQSITTQLVLHSTTTSSNSIRDQTNAEFVTSGQSSSIAWSVGVLVGIVIGMMVVILILLCYTLCYKRFKNRRNISIKSKTCDMASNSVELRTGINDPICNPTYGSHPVVTMSGSSIAKPTDPTDGQYNNIIYEPVYTDADMPEVDNVYSLLGETEHNKQ